MSTADIDRSPAARSRLLAGIAALVAVGTAFASGGDGALVAVVGLAALGLGLLLGDRTALAAGAGVLFLGIVLTSRNAPTPVVPLIGSVAAVVAWDVGENGVSLGEQLGRAARTDRAELVHAAASAAVGLVAVVATYGIYVFATDEQPISALVLLLFAVVVLTATFRD